MIQFADDTDLKEQIDEILNALDRLIAEVDFIK